MAQFHVIAGVDDTPAHPEVRTIGIADIKNALAAGIDDFRARPSHLLFLGLIYPIIGVVLAVWASGANLLPLLFPLMSGFALLGPFAAIGLYEISRRREAGLDSSWSHAFDVRRSPSLPSILALGLMLAIIFMLWLASAQYLYQAFFGSDRPASLSAMLGDILTTRHGWSLIVVGNVVGLVFAAVTLCASVIAFPLLLDRDTGAGVAVVTSFRAVVKNPVAMAIWGVVVATALAAGFLAFFVGLALVIPVLGHATWHLYREVIAPAPRAVRNSQPTA